MGGWTKKGTGKETDGQLDKRKERQRHIEGWTNGWKTKQNTKKKKTGGQQTHKMMDKNNIICYNICTDYRRVVLNWRYN